MKGAKNFRHPEQLPDEIFVTNILPLNVTKDSDDWAEIGWTTKRLGKQAYDRDRNPIEQYRPVFAKKFETERFQMTKHE